MRYMSSLKIFLTVVMLTLTLFISKSVDAAEVFVYPDEFEIGINATEKLVVYDNEEFGTIVFISADEEIATVDNNGIVTGIAEGSTSITAVLRDGARRKELGTAIVTVKESSLDKKVCSGKQVVNQPGMYKTEFWADNVMSISTEEGYIDYLAIKNQNPKAKYKFSSSDKSILRIKNDGTIVEAKRTGTVKITVKEVYNKKTRKLGTFKVTVMSPTLYKEKITVNKGQVISPREIMGPIGDYKAVLTDKKIKSIKKFNADTDIDTLSCKRLEWDDDYFDYVNCLEEGTSYIYLYAYDYERESYKNGYFGRITVNITAEEKINDIWTDLEDFGEDTSVGMYTDDPWEFSILVYTDPYNYSGEMTVTSSNTEIVRIVSFERTKHISEDSYLAELCLEPVNAGEAVVTITACDVEKVIKVYVYEPKGW